MYQTATVVLTLMIFCNLLTLTLASYSSADPPDEPVVNFPRPSHQRVPTPELTTVAALRHAAASRTTATEIHVAAAVGQDGRLLAESLKGNDNALGDAGHPLATVHEAQRRVRVALASNKTGPVIVYLHDGVHFVNESLQLGIEDSGSSERPVVWSGAPGANPTLSGGVPLTCTSSGWQRGECSLSHLAGYNGVDEYVPTFGITYLSSTYQPGDGDDGGRGVMLLGEFDTLHGCQMECHRHPQCGFYTWYDTDQSEPRFSSYCYGLPPRVTSDHPPPASRPATYAFSGWVVSHVFPAGHTLDGHECHSKCEQNDSCVSFTWVRSPSLPQGELPRMGGVGNPWQPPTPVPVDAARQLTHQCYLRYDGMWDPSPDNNATAGHKGCVWKCQLPDLSSNTVPHVRSLFVDNERYVPARFPNLSPSDPSVRGRGYVAPDTVPYWQPVRTQPAMPQPLGVRWRVGSFSPRASNWTRLRHSEVHAFPRYYWGNIQFRVSDVDVDERVVKFAGGGGQINLYKFWYGADLDETSRFMVSHVREELDAPREFYYNSDQRSLEIYTTLDFDPSDHTFIVPKNARVIGVVGDINADETEDDVDPLSEPMWSENIGIENITIAHTMHTYLRRRDAPSGGDWTVHRDGGVFIAAARRVWIANVLFEKVDGNGCFVSEVAREIHVDHCEFAHTGDSAVAIAGRQQLSVGSTHWFPRDVHVTNSHMHHLGFWSKQVSAVFVAVSHRVVIANNKMHTMPRAAIILHDGFAGGHVVEYNSVFDCVLESADHGPFNSWGRERFWPQLYNHQYYIGQPYPESLKEFPAGPVVYDTFDPILVRNNIFKFYYTWPSSFGFAIDLDDGASNYQVYENVCIGSGIKIGATGDLHYVENNIFYDQINRVVQYWLPMYKNHDYFNHNVITGRANQHLMSADLDNKMANGKRGPSKPRGVDYNLYYEPTGHYSESMKDFGMEEHSKFGVDPELQDPENGAFTVAPHSPAIELGFHNFDYGCDEPVGLIDLNTVFDDSGLDDGGEW